MVSSRLSRYIPSRLLLWLALLGFSLPMQASANDVGEYDLKAAFLYNFAVFTQWPGDAPAGMQLCVIGTDPFGPALRKLEDKQVRTAAVAVQRITSNDGIRGCHVLFISASEAANLSRILEASRNLPVLTVADVPGAAASGVMIGLVMQEQRVKFEVNLNAARTARLSISSKLIGLARNVYTP
jgi:hypothetical protein